MAGRAVLVDVQRPLQRRLSRLLAGAGYEVDTHEGDALPPPTPGALYVGSAAFARPLLAAAQAGAPTVIYGDPPEVANLPVADLRCPQLVGLLQTGERLELEAELLALARHQQGLPLPPLQAHLLWGAPAFQTAVADCPGRDQAVQRVHDLCVSLRAPRRIAEAAAEVAHELLTNAMYTAPVDAAGAPRYASDRTAALTLPAADRPTFCFGSDGLRLALEVSDRFGRLHRGHLCRSLARAAPPAGSGRVVVNKGAGGAGIGLGLVARTSEVVQLDVAPGTRTRITAVISLEPRAATEPRGRSSLLLGLPGEDERA